MVLKNDLSIFGGEKTMAQMFNPFMWQQMPQEPAGPPFGRPGFGAGFGGNPRSMPVGAPWPQPANTTGARPVRKTTSNPSADAAKRKKEEDARVLDPSRYKEVNISQADLSRIVALYGNDIENIYDLSPGQRWMFDRGHTEKQVQIMQFVFRAKMAFDAPSFRQRVGELQKKNDNIRTAIAYRGLEKPYKVVLKKRTVAYLLMDSTDNLKSDDEESVNRFINQLIKEDCQRGFNIETDPLIRIGVYKLKDNDYVFLISQPHINTDGSSIGMMVKALFMDYALELNGIDIPEAESSYKEYARYMMGVDKEKQLEYWKNKLDGYNAECHLPGFTPSNGEYSESEYVISISEDVFKKVNRLQSDLRATLFSILQTAWTIALHQITGNKDIIFGTIISGRHSEVKDSMRTLGGFAELVPIRVSIGEDDTLKNLVSEVQKSINEAEKNSDCTVYEIEDYIGRQMPLITHDLNFHNFEMPKVDMFKNGALKGFEMVSGSMHISHMENLSIVFSKAENTLICDFHYNMNRYLPYVVMITAKHFSDVLKNIADIGADIKISDFHKPDIELFDVAQEAYEISNMRKVIAMKSNDLLSGLDNEELFEIARKSDMVGYMSGNMLFNPDDELDSVPLLIFGKVQMSSRDENGWQKTAGTLSGQGILTCTALTGEKTGTTATVEENNTTVLYIPKEVFESILADHEGLALKLAVIMERRGRNSSCFKGF